VGGVNFWEERGGTQQIRQEDWVHYQDGADEAGLVFETTQVQEEFARIKALGAQVIREPYAIGEGWIATLADPDGNYFQLTTPMG
jgi:predicted enzyme related to lactoylglutathione lyase